VQLGGDLGVRPPAADPQGDLALARAERGESLTGSIALSLVMLVLCLLLALAATAVAGSGVADTWSLAPGMVAQFALALATAMAIGIGFGGVLLSSAPAIVVYFALPVAWSAIGGMWRIAHAEVRGT
jgi:ABC-2 type transport system permease protein